MCKYHVSGSSISGDIQRRRWAVFGFFPAIVLLRYPKASPTALATREQIILSQHVLIVHEPICLSSSRVLLDLAVKMVIMQPSKLKDEPALQGGHPKETNCHGNQSLDWLINWRFHGTTREGLRRAIRELFRYRSCQNPHNCNVSGMFLTQKAPTSNASLNRFIAGVA